MGEIYNKALKESKKFGPEEEKKVDDPKIKEVKLKLKRTHLYQLSKIFGKMGIILGLKSFNEIEVGEKLILQTLANIWKAEYEIDSLLAEITNVDMETIKDMDYQEYIDLWKQLFENVGFKNFFSMASSLMKPRT